MGQAAEPQKSRFWRRWQCGLTITTALGIVGVSLAPSQATTVTQNGTPGSAGTAGSAGPNGTAGGTGGSGGSAAANANSPGDLSNSATAVGGAGGLGGAGGQGTMPGGSGGIGGAGGSGGNATASATTAASGLDVKAIVSATGGAGGVGGVGGTAAEGTAGRGGAGANGGIATASASASNSHSSGQTSVEAIVTGGDGGHGGFANVVGGNGGQGASVSLVDAVNAVASTSGKITLKQTAVGGSGGDTHGGLAGNGGTGTSSLSRNLAAADLSIYSSAGGGEGGMNYRSTGAVGSGGDAYADSNAINPSGAVTSWANAHGGAGGTAQNRMTGIVGGNASASSNGINSTNLPVIVGATATGGYGGENSTSFFGATNSNAGDGGQATVSAVGISTGGAEVDVRGFQLGGQGGRHTFGPLGNAGNGAASVVTNAVRGSTTGHLKLWQEARGGSGGSANGANGGHGGIAVSTLTAANPTGGRLTTVANAFGGFGGTAVASGAPGDGGDATATVFGSSDFGPQSFVSVAATATAQDAAANATNGAKGLQGIATALAQGTTKYGAPVGADATAKGNNSSSALARAESSAGIIAAMRMLTEVPAHPNISVSADCRIDGGFNATTFGIWAAGGGLPREDKVADSLEGNSNVAAAYSPVFGGRKALALASLALTTPNVAPTWETTLRASALLSIDAASIATGRVLVGLLDPVSGGADFTSLRFSIEREGGVVLNQAFASSADANAYFNDRALDLGSLSMGVNGALDLQFNLEMTTLDNGTRFATTFFVAGVGIAVSGLPGDYNEDGAVDAADYTVWRDRLGGTNSLPNDDTVGVGADDYQRWKSHFGESQGSGGISLESVPEPTAWISLALGMIGAFGSHARRRSGYAARRIG